MLTKSRRPITTATTLPDRHFPDWLLVITAKTTLLTEKVSTTELFL